MRKCCSKAITWMLFWEAAISLWDGTYGSHGRNGAETYLKNKGKKLGEKEKKDNTDVTI